MMSGERTHTSLLTSKHHVLTSQGSPIPVYGSFIPHWSCNSISVYFITCLLLHYKLNKQTPVMAVSTCLKASKQSLLRFNSQVVPGDWLHQLRHIPSRRWKKSDINVSNTQWAKAVRQHSFRNSVVFTCVTSQEYLSLISSVVLIPSTQELFGLKVQMFRFVVVCAFWIKKTVLFCFLDRAFS